MKLRPILAAALLTLSTPAAAAPSIVATHQQFYDLGELNGPYTQTSVPIGTDVPSRVVVCRFYVGLPAGTISSVTINGVSAVSKVTNASTSRLLEHWEATGVTGTTATIVITASATSTRCAMDVVTVTGQAVPGATAVSGSTPTPIASGTSVPIGAVTGDVILGAAFVNSTTGDITWSGSGGVTVTRYAHEQVGAGPIWSTCISTGGTSIVLTATYGGVAVLWRGLAVGYS